MGPATLLSSAKSRLADTRVTSDLSLLTVDVCQHLRTVQGDPRHNVPPGVQTRVPWVGDETWPPPEVGGRECWSINTVSQTTARDKGQHWLPEELCNDLCVYSKALSQSSLPTGVPAVPWPEVNPGESPLSMCQGRARGAPTACRQGGDC